MKPLILVLIIISFIQSTILPLDLVLIILICRSFVEARQGNFWLAFSFGLLLSALSGQPLGLLSLFYLAAVLAAGTLKQSRFSSTWITVLPMSLAILLSGQLLVSLLNKTAFSLTAVFYQLALVLPTFLIISFWEERFVVKPEVKLKIGNQR